MNVIVEIWQHIEIIFNDHLADEILSFFVEKEIDYDTNSDTLESCPFHIAFPGLKVRLKNLENLEKCLSHRFICHLDINRAEIGDEGAIALAGSLKMNSTLQGISLYANKIGVKTIEFENEKYDTFFNINTAEDLKYASNLLERINDHKI